MNGVASFPPATSAAAFEARYRESADPWQFATSTYEQQRYTAIIDALLLDRYGTAFEPGCSVGELTALLAGRCDRVIATDFAPSAVAVARKRCATLPNVDIRVADAAGSLPAGTFDLVVFSEIGYYFEPDDLRALALKLHASLLPGGEFVAAHWLGHSVDHPQHGDAVHAQLLECLPMKWSKGARHAGFRIDSWKNI